MRHAIISLLLLTALISGCYFDNEEELYGINPNDCDTTAVSYATDIWPLIQGNCLTACHAAGGSAGGIVFENYASVKARVDNGSLMNRVVTLRNMPPNAALTDCQVNKVQKWILDGGLDN